MKKFSAETLIDHKVWSASILQGLLKFEQIISLSFVIFQTLLKFTISFKSKFCSFKAM